MKKRVLSLTLALCMLLSLAPLTLYAVSDEALTVKGTGINGEYVFYKGEDSRGFELSANPLPADITDCVWSAEGLPDGLTIVEISPEGDAILTGTPTALSDFSDAKIIVTATDKDGKNYRGELEIRVKVEKPYANVTDLLPMAECTLQMTTANTQEAVLNWLKTTWMPGVLADYQLPEGQTLSDFEFSAQSFEAATAGTLTDTDGTDGTMVFSVSLDEIVVPKLVCTITASVFTPGLSDLLVYLFYNDSVNLADASRVETGSSLTVNGVHFSGDLIYIEGKNTDVVRIGFATSGENPFVFGRYTAKPVNQRRVEAGASNPVKYASEGSFTNSGVTLSTGTITVNSGHGEYKGAHGMRVNFTNNSSSDKYAAYTIILTDSNGSHRTITLVTKTKAQPETDAWGVEVTNGGVTNFVNASGITSAEISEGGNAWLKEESGEISAWYAIDNSDGVFESGSRFWIKRLDRAEDEGGWNGYYEQLDEQYKESINNGNAQLFLVGVTSPSGTEYTNLSQSVNLQVQLGDDWGKSDLQAVFISSDEDELIDVNYTPDLDHPEGVSNFATLNLNHFSAYVVFEAKASALTPQTGDNSNMLLWIALMFVFGSSVATMIIYGKRKRLGKNG